MTRAWELRWPAIRPWHTNLGLLLLGAGLVAMSQQFLSEYHHFAIGFSGVSGWSAILYMAACAVILTGPVDRLTFPIILGVAVLCRLIVLLPAPFLSTDVYRYVWDGLVQHAHINPYRYVPSDPALQLLRDHHSAIFDHINRRSYARTMYPPAAQGLFYLTTAISPTVTWMKAVMVLFEGVTLYGLVQFLAIMGIRREQTLLYAWCPLLFQEIAASGHVDSAAIAFMVLALLVRARHRPVATGLFLGLAVLTKLYPLVLLPALYRRGDWKMPATLATVVAAGYAAYASAGTMIFGFFSGYAREEGLKSGERYFLLDWARHLPGLESLPPLAFYLFCAAIFAALTVWAWRATSQANSDSHSVDSPNPKPATLVFLAPAFGLAAALMLLFSPHYAWYIAWLVPFFCLLPNLPALAYLMGFFYGYTTALATPGPKIFLLNEYLYATVLAAILVHIGLRQLPDHWPVHRRRPQAQQAEQSSAASDPL
ncbi:MAG TPA: glycosyltransferase family 87 protein [Granulicella sp.]|jgi:alpha-1,6-mannosyltransferase|nr:glycosyltransferase family 87 protein [Granulicella sp.]